MTTIDFQTAAPNHLAERAEVGVEALQLVVDVGAVDGKIPGVVRSPSARADLVGHGLLRLGGQNRVADLVLAKARNLRALVDVCEHLPVGIDVPQQSELWTP